MRTNYTIKRVVLKNFISHRETTIDFDQGVTVLIGPNGAGKTSILEAIYFALTGKGWRAQRRKKDLINTGAREAVVEMIMKIGDNEELYIKRKIPGTPADTILQIRRNGKTIDTARGEAQVNNKIREILGLDPEKLRTIAIIPQGGITRLFTTLTPSERKRIIDTLLGIDDYEKAYQNLAELPVKAPKELASIGLTTLTPRQSTIKNLEKYLTETLPRETREAIEQREKLEREIHEIDKGINETMERLKEITKQLENITREIEELEQARINYERLLAKKETLTHDLEDIQNKIKEHMEKLTRITEELEKKRFIEELLEAEKDYAEYKHKKLRLEELREKIKSIEEEIAKLEPIKKKLEELSARIKTPLEQLEKDYHEKKAQLEEKKASLEEIINELEILGKEEAGLAREIQNIEKEITEFIKEANMHLGIIVESPEELIEKIHVEIEKLNSEYTRLNNEIKEIEKKIGRLEADKKREQEKLEILTRTGEGRCPLCGQPLTETHRKKIIEETSRNLELIESELARLYEEKKMLEEKLEELEQFIEKTRSLTARTDHVEALLEKLEKAKPRLEELRRNIREKARHKEDLETEIKNLEAALDELNNMINDAKIYSDLIKLTPPEKLDELNTMKTNVETEIEELRKWIEGFEARIKNIVGAETVDYEELFSRARKAYDILVMLAGQKEELERTIEKLRAEEKQKQEMLREINEELSKLQKQVEKLDELRKHREELEKKREELSRREAELKAKRESLAERIKELAERIEELRARDKAVRETLYRLKILMWIRDNILHRDKAPALLRRRYTKLIEALMRKLIKTFELGYNDVSIDDDFNIYLKAPGARTPIEIARLSGGEKVVVSLVAMLALHKVVGSDKLGFLILDEPTEFLDDERRRKLIDLLKKFGGGEVIRQLIIVTHDEEIKEAAETLYRVYKVDGFSRVEKMEIGE